MNYSVIVNESVEKSRCAACDVVVLIISCVCLKGDSSVLTTAVDSHTGGL